MTTQALSGLETWERRNEPSTKRGSCYSVCNRDPWGAWDPCDSSCGGKRMRIRTLCCRPHWDAATCLSTCHFSVSDLIQVEPCRKECVFGVYSRGSCHCDDKGYGDCCQFSNVTCSDSPCAHNATCVNGDHRYECQCPYGWSGPNCNVVFTTTTAAPTTTTDATAPSSKMTVSTVATGIGLLVLFVGAFCLWWFLKSYCKGITSGAGAQVAVQHNARPSREEDVNVHHIIMVAR
ncbi:hypothetical protein LSAT2_025734 [Lamellibrachia satsuma]|nr:hypothetical protein LSAT2_025734 [Lamellibrachia satsuma]